MNNEEFSVHVDKTVAELRNLLVVKGGEYAGSEDRLANFKRGAALTGATPLQVAFVYASKHYDAIATYIRDMASLKTRPRSESIEGRFDDLMNYMMLMKALVVEGKQSPVRITDVMPVRFEAGPPQNHGSLEVGDHS